MKTLLLIFSLSVFAVNTSEAALFGRFVNVQQTQPKKLTEAQKIEQLIVFISKQEGTFIRNGSEYTPAQAAEHLRMKWKKAGSQIKTAADFIEKLGSTSSMSGKPYQIKFKNGRTVNLGPLLRAELERLEKIGA